MSFKFTLSRVNNIDRILLGSCTVMPAYARVFDATPAKHLFMGNDTEVSHED